MRKLKFRDCRAKPNGGAAESVRLVVTVPCRCAALHRTLMELVLYMQAEGQSSFSGHEWATWRECGKRVGEVAASGAWE